MAAAREADVLVLGLGITERDRRAGIYQETEGHDRTSIDLPSVQKELARKLIALGWAWPEAFFQIGAPTPETMCERDRQGFAGGR